MGKALQALSGLDAAFLYLESSGTPMHVGSVMLLEVPARQQPKFLDKLASHLRERLPRAPVLRKQLHAAPLGLGHPLWSELPDIDLKQHLRKRRLAGDGGRARLDALVAKLHAEPLSRERPLWQFVLIDNVEPGVVALYSKVHHALLDGQGGVALARASALARQAAQAHVRVEVDAARLGPRRMAEVERHLAQHAPQRGRARQAVGEVRQQRAPEGFARAFAGRRGPFEEHHAAHVHRRARRFQVQEARVEAAERLEGLGHAARTIRPSGGGWARAGR
jgi:hypothetical protein